DNAFINFFGIFLIIQPSIIHELINYNTAYTLSYTLLYITHKDVCTWFVQPGTSEKVHIP
ncbi:MAG: hypothetical protein C4B59_16820, partial [Candidatus Methanogaster sp.]